MLPLMASPSKFQALLHWVHSVTGEVDSSVSLKLVLVRFAFESSNKKSGLELVSCGQKMCFLIQSGRPEGRQGQVLCTWIIPYQDLALSFLLCCHLLFTH